ncbi:MAG: hypothetical protein AB1330_00955 [Bacillota bacterium]
MVVDGFYLWPCSICGEMQPESPDDTDAGGWGNLILVEGDNGETLIVCRDCINESMAGKGLGFLMAGVSYAGPRAREWANQIIDGMLTGEDFPEYQCGHWEWHPEECV